MKSRAGLVPFADATAINAITNKVLGAAFAVSNGLGPGFLEKVYVRALACEMAARNLRVSEQVGIDVRYNGIVVGQYYADIIVDNAVVVEAKAVRSIDPVHIAQCINYLRASGKTVCILLNFGVSPLEYKRIVHDLRA